MFLESDFIYNDISSNEFDLKILQVDSNAGTEEVQSVPNKEFSTITSTRSNKRKIIGVVDNEPISFSVKIISYKKDYIDRSKIDKIHDWLFNQPDYKKLRIIQDDMQSYYFNCIFTDCEDIYFGNEIIGISATVECDGSYAYENDTVLKWTGLEDNVMKDLYVNVQRCGVYGIKPVIEFTLADDTQDFAIINVTTQINPIPFQEKSVTFGFIGLLQGDTITVDCDKQMIYAESGNRIYDNFTGQFMYLKQGINHLILWAKLKEFKITFRNERRIGV